MRWLERRARDCEWTACYVRSHSEHTQIKACDEGLQIGCLQRWRDKQLLQRETNELLTTSLLSIQLSHIKNV